MRILLVHNFYQFRGGEDEVVENEQALLEKYGNKVETYFVDSSEIKGYSILKKALVIPQTIFNRKRGIEVVNKAKKINADIVHIHNFWPLISPSIFFELNKAKIPYIQTVHNFRYTVANALLESKDWNQSTKELTIQHRPFNSLKKSYLMTFIYWLTSRFVRWSKVLKKGPGALLFLNSFGADVQERFFPGVKTFIKGNFLPLQQIYDITTDETVEPYFLFLSRLSEEKGIELLLEAYQKSSLNTKLKIAGTGPLLKKLQQKYKSEENIEFLGFVSGETKAHIMAKAIVLAIPSTCLENFPVTIVEANTYGTPVIASNSGGLPYMIDPNITGLLFESGNVLELSQKLQWCEKHPDELKEMGTAAQIYAEENFSEEKNYEQLMTIYQNLIASVQED